MRFLHSVSDTQPDIYTLQGADHVAIYGSTLRITADVLERCTCCILRTTLFPVPRSMCQG